MLARVSPNRMSDSPIRLLIIDDDRLQHRLVAEAVKNFRSGPYEVEWAASYESGVEQLMGGAFHVCLLDYSLGDGDGLALLRDVRGRGNHTPVIFLTANADPAIDQAALDAGALDYLVKGQVTPELLERSLRYTRRLGDMLANLRELASHDQLTGVLNRREFNRVLREEWDRSVRFGQPHAVLLIDVDHFKQVNDRHGHKAGDDVLKWVARLLVSNTRGVDRVFRFGGDEFAVVLIEADEHAALVVARRLVDAVGQTPLPAGAPGEHQRVSLSVGAAAVTPALDSSEALLRCADRALYASKHAGRNRATAWSAVPRT